MRNTLNKVSFVNKSGLFFEKFFQAFLNIARWRQLLLRDCGWVFNR